MTRNDETLSPQQRRRAVIIGFGVTGLVWAGSFVFGWLVFGRFIYGLISVALGSFLLMLVSLGLIATKRMRSIP